MQQLEPLVARGGRYLIECSGNVDQSSYGLMSAGEWDGVPLRAVVERAIRVEQWPDNRATFYRVIGIVWGGSRPTNALSIRFKSGAPWIRVEDCPMPASTLTWSLWSHTWRPTTPGRYQMVLRVDDPSIRTRRLDLFFYVREVVIDDI
jgi:hypothetical protein